MDPESPVVGRVERTFWTVWYYITGAVNRLLRPEPANGNEPNSLQESAVDSEHAKVSHLEDEVNWREVDEEQPLAPASRPAVAWDLCTADIDLGPDVETMQYKSGKKDSVEDEDTRGEELKQTEYDDLGLLVVKDEKAKEHEEEDRTLYTHRQDETLENDEYDERVNTRAQMLKSDATSDDLAGSEDESEREMRPDVPQKMEETETTIEDKVEENEHDLDAEGIEIKSCTVTECSPNIHIEKEDMQKNETDTLMKHEEVENSQDVLSTVQDEKQLSASEKCSNEELLIAYNKNIIELIVAGKEHVMAPRNMSNKSEDVKEKEDKSTMEEREQEAVIEEENVNAAENKQALDQVLEQEDNSQTVPEDSKKDPDSNDQKSCSDEVVLSAKTELQISGEQEDVAKEANVQTKIRDTKSHDASITEQFVDKPSDISVDERSLDKDQAQEDIKECWGVRACTAISVTVKPEGETGQEESWEFQNIPQGVFEGRSDVSPELNPPTCEETQEGVPECNNEPGPDENTTQRFLEVEVHTTQLPEEVESKEPESLQNSGRSTGADCLLVQEHMEEVQESKEDIKRHSALVCAELPNETGKPLVEPTAQEPGPLFVEEDGTFMVAQMKTGIEHSENELETGLTKKEDLQDEEPLVEMDEGSFDSQEADAAGDGFEATENLVGGETLKSPEAEEEMTTETIFQELVDAKKTEQNSNRTSGVQDDIPDIGFVKQSVVTELISNKETELQDTGNNVELEVYKVEEEAAEVQMQNKNEVEIFDLQVAGMEAEITTEKNDLISELTLSMKSLETKNQLPDIEATHEPETIEPKPKHDVCMIATDEMQKNMMESEGSCGEETVCSISPSQDVIDEEILDMWMETLSEDYEKHQAGPELGPQMNPEIEPSKHEQTQQDTEQLVESNSGESELVSDTEMSSSTAESGFSDQSLNEWGPQNSEMQLLKSTSPGSVQGIYDMLVNVSESGNILELSPQQHNSGCQDTMMEETPDARQLYLKDEESVTGFPLEERDSGEVRHLDQESDQTQEKTHEENGFQKEIDGKVTDLLSKTDFKTTVEADVTSLTEVDALFQPEKSKVETFETLEITASESQEEIHHTESARSRSDSEASSEEGILSSESGSQDDTSTQSEKTLLKLPFLEKKQLGFTEEIDDSLPGLTGTEVAEQLQTESGDQIEVDASVLDFSAQRSRIAVKNPRVRPPKDPRSLLHMPSVDPTPASCLPVKVPAGVPFGGIGIGVKLPGLGAGFPVLKKTKQMMRKENSPDSNQQEPDTKPEEKSIAPEQDEAQHKPKWMPPRHPGFGNPLMSELKTKLKKTTKD